MRIELFVIALLFAFSCTREESDSQIAISESENRIIFNDSNKTNLIKDTATSITVAKFHPLYFGIPKNKIDINHNIEELGFEFDDWSAYRYPDTTDLSIFVDTSQIIASLQPYSQQIIDQNNQVKFEIRYHRLESYPVTILNVSSDTLNIGYGIFLPMVIEAVDSSGSWQPIQELFIYFCGTGLSHYYLPPGNIVVSACKKFEGSYSTKMRLVYGFHKECYSNEFWGTMDYKQFAAPSRPNYW